MTRILKFFVRTGVVLGVLGAIGVGGMMAIAGEARTRAALSEVQTRIVDQLDTTLDFENPAALRKQIRKLSGEYPERIRQVRNDLAELGGEIRQLEREKAISDRVVDLAEDDLAALEPILQNASAAELTSAGSRNVLTATVRFEGKLYTIPQAQNRANQIRQTRIAHANRGADSERDLVYLQQQEERLTQLLLQLETERGQFEAQLAQLDRQVDAIARNERLIALTEKRQRTIQECSSYEAASLDQLFGRLGEIRSRQEATLEYLSSDQSRVNYEDMARMQLDSEDFDVAVPSATVNRTAVSSSH